MKRKRGLTVMRRGKRRRKGRKSECSIFKIVSFKTNLELKLKLFKKEKKIEEKKLSVPFWLLFN